MSKLLITIDVEADCDIHWKRTNPMSFYSVTQGIPNFLRPIWDNYNIKPIYFVSPEVLKDSKSCQALKQEIKQGAVIGAHLHSEHIEPESNRGEGVKYSEYPCYDCTDEIEFEKIKNLTNLIKKKLDIVPEWYRAARFGADIETIKSLKKLGYKYDSSVTPCIDWGKQGGPNHSKAPNQPYYISRADLCTSTTKEEEGIGIKEFPITIKGKRCGFFGKFLPNDWFFYSWLRPSHMTVFEQKNLIKSIKKEHDNPTLVMMFHSMEVIPGKSPYVRNKIMQKRFLNNIEKVIRYIENEK